MKSESVAVSRARRLQSLFSQMLAAGGREAFLLSDSRPLWLAASTVRARLTALAAFERETSFWRMEERGGEEEERRRGGEERRIYKQARRESQALWRQRREMGLLSVGCVHTHTHCISVTTHVEGTHIIKLYCSTQVPGSGPAALLSSPGPVLLLGG